MFQRTKYKTDVTGNVGMTRGVTPLLVGVLDLEDLEQPVVDLTPSPAVSSFVFYEGDAFPAWRGHMLVGSLRAADLFRVQVDGDRFVEKETLVEDLARVRDIEVGVDGLVYLVLEHATGWTIVRLAPPA